MKFTENRLNYETFWNDIFKFSVLYNIEKIYRTLHCLLRQIWFRLISYHLN
jgi:hypothetical protein